MRWYNKIAYHFFKFILKVFIYSVTNFKYKIKKYEEGPKIYAINHPTEYDAYPVFIVAKDYVHTLIEENVWSFTIPRIIFKLTDQIKIIRGEKSYLTIEESIEKLKRGESLLIAPEGERIDIGERVRAKRGVVRIALKMKVPIIPIGAYIDDKDIVIKKIKFKKFKYEQEYYRPKFRANYGVVFGEPIYFKEYFDKEISKEEMQELANVVLEKIYDLREEAKELFKQKNKKYYKK